MITIDDNNKSKCCACTACYNICPQNCIEMKRDNEGFLYPSVNQEKCINCTLCEKICPIINNNQHEEETIAIAAYNKNDNSRMKSSSGGLFSAFANSILNKGGVVFGAAFNSEWGVHHVCAKNLEELEALYGSKYVQSNLEDVFKEVKDCIKNQKQVLFTGTACQIAGLKKYLGKFDNEKLYTIDVLCHGVPNDILLKKYIKWQEKQYGAPVERISFRDKKYGWKNFAMLLEFSNNTTYEKINSDDPFMQMFIGNICLRPSCHHCSFKTIERISDITIGDCWKIETHSPEMDDDCGTSVVLIHSEKGLQLYKSIKGQIIEKIIDIKDAIPENAESLNSAIPHMNRSLFFKELQKNADIPELVKLLKLTLFQRIIRKVNRYYAAMKSRPLRVLCKLKRLT